MTFEIIIGNRISLRGIAPNTIEVQDQPEFNDVRRTIPLSCQIDITISFNVHDLTDQELTKYFHH